MSSKVNNLLGIGNCGISLIMITFRRASPLLLELVPIEMFAQDAFSLLVDLFCEMSFAVPFLACLN